MSSKITLEAIEIIDAIHREGSFAAAAVTLYKVPSALTYTVKKLEESLDLTIFDRSGHRATLTEAGKALLNEGRLLLNSAHNLEAHVQRIASGVETNIGIAVNDLYDIKPILKILAQFYAQGFGTQVKITQEVFGGNWEAVLSGRADIVIGAPGDAPSGARCATKHIGDIQFVFAVAPQHPLAMLQHPLSDDDIKPYRSVASSDSSRDLPPRTRGIILGQEILTVPNMHFKTAAQVAGLGVGYLPEKLAKQQAKAGKLIIKPLLNESPALNFSIAWKNTPMGKSKKWLLKAFEALNHVALCV